MPRLTILKKIIVATKCSIVPFTGKTRGLSHKLRLFLEIFVTGRLIFKYILWFYSLTKKVVNSKPKKDINV